MNSLQWLLTKAWVLFLRVVGVLLLIITLIAFVAVQGIWNEGTSSWVMGTLYFVGGLGFAFLAQSTKK